MSRNDDVGKVAPRGDGSRKPGGPAPKDERRETEERLAEAMGGAERRKARDALKDDPSLPDPAGTGQGKPGSKESSGRR